MGKRIAMLRWLAAGAVLAASLAACSLRPGDEQDETPDATEVAGQVPPAEPTMIPTPEPTPTPELTPTLTADQLAQVQPNELGQIMVLEYHGIDETGAAYSRTPEKFRQDLQWLYDNDFYVIPIRDMINNEIKAPAGKKPVVLTFDDGLASQFRYEVDASGQKTLDPNSGIGILEEFFTTYPDFGRGGLFSILPLAPFAWPDEEDQRSFAGEKLQWLIEHGYEIGNHTVGHVNMREISPAELEEELAGANDLITELAPEAAVEVISVPFGVYPPKGDTSIFEHLEYNGKTYQWIGALMVGANPSPSPVHAEWDPMWIPRIQAIDEEIEKWFGFVENNPDIMYVSDGNPETIAVPEKLPAGLAGALDEEKVGEKTLIRY